MSTAGSYPVSAFSETKTFLVYDPSSQTTQRVLGSDLVNYITPNLNYVRTNTTRATAQTIDYDIGIFVQVAGGTAIGDGGSSMMLVVASGEGDYVMNNGNELLVLPRGSLAGSDLDGALVTDNGVQREIQDAISLRKITANSFAALMLLDLSGVDIASTASFYDGEAKGAADYAPDGTTGTASTAYADNSGFYDANGDGFSLAFSLLQEVNPAMFGATGDGDTINNVEDDPALHYMFTATPNGMRIRNAHPSDVYVISTRREYEDKYFDLAISLKAKRATYWDFLLFSVSGSTPLPWFKLGGKLDGNKSQQWYMPAPSISTVDEYGNAYGKAYADPTIDYHTPSSTTGLSTTTEDTTGYGLYAQGNRGIITISDVEHFYGENIEYSDLCRDGIVVQEVRKTFETIGSRGDGQLLVNFSEMSGEGYSNPFEAAYEKVVFFNTDDTAQEELTKPIRVAQIDSYFGDCAYALFVRTNNPKYENAMLDVTYSGTIRNCSRQGVWIERARRVDITLDSTGEHKPLHDYRGSDGGVYIGNGCQDGVIRGRINNGDVNGNNAQAFINVNCENLTVIKTKNDSNYAINNVNKATSCYVESATNGINASKIIGCTVPIASGNAINVTSKLGDSKIGVKRHTESSQTFNPSAGTTAYVLSTATDPYTAGGEGYFRVVRKNVNINGNTPFEVDAAYWTVSGSGSSTTITTDYDSQTDDEVIIYWVEVHTTTIASASGTTHTSTLAGAWEVVSVTVDASPYTLGDVRFAGSSLGATEYSISRNSSNQIEVELGTSMTGSETVEIKVLPTVVTTAQTVRLNGVTASNNTLIGSRYQCVGTIDKITGGTIEDCPYDEAVIGDSSEYLEINGLTLNRVWQTPMSIEDTGDALKFYAKGVTVLDGFMSGDTTDTGRLSVFGEDGPQGIRADIVIIEGGYFEQTGKTACTQNTTYISDINGNTNRFMISGTKRLGHSFLSGSAGSTGYDASNVDLAPATIAAETATYS